MIGKTKITELGHFSNMSYPSWSQSTESSAVEAGKSIAVQFRPRPCGAAKKTWRWNVKWLRWLFKTFRAYNTVQEQSESAYLRQRSLKFIVNIIESVQLRKHCNSKATRLRASRSGVLSAFCGFSVFFVRKYCVLGRFGKIRLATTHAEHVAPRPLLNVK